MAKKTKVIVKKLILDVDQLGEFKGGRVLYGLKVNGIVTPQNYTMGTPDWFEAADLRKLLRKAKEKIEQGENIVPET